MDDKSFLELCINENKLLASIEEKEVVSDETAYKALIIVKNMLVDGVGDALLYAAALNILNTYVKQSKENKKTVGYSFKKNVDVLLKYIIKHPGDNMIAEIQEDNGMPLAMVSIYTIQFSFHNITVTEETSCLQELDETKQKLKFDNIRKQTCSCTLFDFSYNNDYDRTYKMLDGSDFTSEMSSLVDEFHAGTKTIEDVLHVIYKSDKLKDLESDDLKTFPSSNSAIVALAAMNSKAFIANVHNKSMTPLITKIMKEMTGISISASNSILSKYAFEYICSLFKEAEINPDTYIGICYSRIPGKECVFLVLGSKNSNDESVVSTLIMLPWTSLKLIDDENVSYYDPLFNLNLTSRHPSLITDIFDLSEFDKFFPDYLNRSLSVLFFDCCKTEENDIISSVSDKTRYNPTFYGDERESIIEYLKPVTDYGCGEEVIFDVFSSIDSFANHSNGDLSSEHLFALTSCAGDAYIKKNSFHITNVRQSAGNNAYINALKNEYDKLGIKYDMFASKADFNQKKSADVAIFYGVYPSEQSLADYTQVVFVCDMYNPGFRDSNLLSGLYEYASDHNKNVVRKDITSALGFCDDGAGNGWLIRKFNLASIDYQYWNPKKYQISVFKAVEEMTCEQGIKNISVPASLHISDVTDSVVGNIEDMQFLYEELNAAPSGVKLLIADDELYSFISKKLEDHSKDGSLYKGTDPAKKDKLFDAVLKYSSNTTLYNKYLSFAVEHLHIDAWNKLCDDCKDWVVSALTSYYSMASDDTNMDFSGPVLLISKTYEFELCQRLSVDYTVYLKNKYGDNYLYHLPDGLKKETKDGIKPTNEYDTTLGSLPNIMGLNSKGKIKCEEDHKEFLAYCEDELLVTMDDVEKQLADMCEVIYQVRVKYRNTSAHKTSIAYETATECVSYCITDDRTLGVLMDMFRK